MLLIATTVVDVAGCSKQQSGARGQPHQPTSVGVYTVSPERYTLKSTLPGRAAAYASAAVRPQVQGIIEKRLFKQGGHVKEGQVLYRLDPATYKAAYDNAKGTLAEARAAVKAAKSKAERYTRAARISAVSELDKDSAVAALAQAKATVQADKASLETAHINLGYTRIRAPIAGVIGASSVTAGALVTDAQTTALATILQLDPIYVNLQQTDTQFLDLKQAVRHGKLQTVDNNKVPITVSPAGNPDITLAGKLQFAGASVNETSGTVMLRAIVKNPNHDLLPGMYVNATLPQGVVSKALLVPQQGVTRDAAGTPRCLVVTGDNKVASRTLTIAGAAGNRWRVTKGLAAGDRVIIQGVAKVHAGESVKTVAVTADGKPVNPSASSARNGAGSSRGPAQVDSGSST